MFNTLKIGKVDKAVQELVDSYKHDNIELDQETLKDWISEASDYDCISKYELMKINSYLIENGTSMDNLLKVYSYLNSNITLLSEDE